MPLTLLSLRRLNLRLYPVIPQLPLQGRAVGRQGALSVPGLASQFFKWTTRLQGWSFLRPIPCPNQDTASPPLSQWNESLNKESPRLSKGSLKRLNTRPSISGVIPPKKASSSSSPEITGMWPSHRRMDDVALGNVSARGPAIGQDQGLLTFGEKAVPLPDRFGRKGVNNAPLNEQPRVSCTVWPKPSLQYEYELRPPQPLLQWPFGVTNAPLLLTSFQVKSPSLLHLCTADYSSLMATVKLTGNGDVSQDWRGRLQSFPYPLADGLPKF